MATRNFSVRLTAEGGAQLIQVLKDAAASSTEAEAALRNLSQSSPQLASVADGVQAKLGQVADKLKDVSGTANAANAPLGQNVKNLKDHGEASGQAAFAARQLGVQIEQTISGIATGQPVLMTLIQQGHQVTDVMTATGVGFREMGAAAKDVFFALGGFYTLGGAVAIAGLGELIIQSEKAVSQNLALQTALRATRDDYVAMAAEATAAAHAVAATTGIGSADARSAAQAFAAAPNFHGTQAQLEALIKSAHDLAVVMGVTLPVEAKELAAAMQDPGAEADKLAKEHFPGFTQALAETIKQMQASGETGKAFGIVMDTIRDHVDGAADASKTRMQVALEDLGKAFTSTGNDGKSFANVLANEVDAVLAGVVKSITAVVNTIDWVRQHIPNSVVNGVLGAIPGVGAIQGLAQFGGNGSAPIPANALGAVQSGIQTSVITSAAVNGLDPSFLARLQLAEGVFKNGQWLTSGAGAVGPMQVEPATFSGMLKQPSAYPTVVGLNDLSNTSQNVAAGSAYLSHLLNKYGDPAVAVMAYHDGEPAVDAIIAQLPGAVTQDPAILHQAIANAVSPAAAAEAARVTAGYAGTGLAVAAAAKASGGTYGDTLSPQQQIDNALGVYLKQNTLSAQITANKAAQDTVSAGIAAATQTGDVESVKKLSEALADLKLKEADLLTPQEKLAQAAKDSIAALSAQSGYERDMAQVEAQFTKVTKDGTVAIDEHALAINKAAEQVKLATNYSDAIEATNKATDAELRIAAAYDGTAASLTHAQNYEKAYAQALLDFDRNSPDFTQHVLDYAGALDRSSDATLRLQQEQSSVQALTGAFSSAMDQLGQGIANAFLSGSGQAVNFGNIVRSVIGSIISEVAKLAIINSIFQQNNPTLGAALGALGNNSSAASPGSSGGFGGLSNLSSALSIGKLFSGSGSTGGIRSGLSSLFSTGSTSGLLTGLGGLFSTGAASNATLLASDLGGITAGAGSIGGSAGLLGGLGSSAGAAFSSIPIIGWVIGAALNASQNLSSGTTTSAPNLLTTAFGGLDGNIIGIPGLGKKNSTWGTAIGSVLGGVVGSLIGRQFGPKPASPYSQTNIGVDNGLLTVGASMQQIDASNLQQTTQDVTALDAALQSLGITITSLGGITQTGQNTPGGFQDPSKAADIASAFPSFRFGVANDNTLNAYLGKTSFASLSDLQTAVSTYETLVKTTIPALTGQTAATNSLQQAIDAINAQFNAAITTAQQYGVATDSLTAAQQKAVDQAKASAANAAQDQTNVYAIRGAIDAASLSGNPQDMLAAQLWQFDRNAWAEKTQLDASLTATFGDSYRATAQYADEMAQLETDLGQERLAIQKQYNSQLAATAQSAVSGLSTWLTNFMQGSASPLNDNAKLSLAAGQWSKDAAAAQGGNLTAIQALTGDANAYLSAGRSVYGSGTGYVSIVDAITSTIGKVTSLPSDTLTAGVLQSEIRTQTQQLTDTLNAIVDAVNGVRTQLKLTPLPTRIAA